MVKIACRNFSVLTSNSCFVLPTIQNSKILNLQAGSPHIWDYYLKALKVEIGEMGYGNRKGY